MKRTSALALTVCLAVGAALAMGAAPALAADGCDCHTTVPPSPGAQAAHAPFVAGVNDCSTCHVSWAVPHPVVAGGLFADLRGRSSDAGYRLNGRVGFASPMVFIGHRDVLVYLQQRLWGAAEFTDLTQVTTGTKGGFAFTMASAPPFATYRSIAQGHVFTLSGGGTRLYAPKATTLLPTPTLTLKLHGRFDYGIITHAAYLTLGDSVRVNGTVRPRDLGGKVTIRVQRRVNHNHHKWITRITVKRVISATGTYSWTFTPGTRGRYWVGATIPATAAHTGAGTGFIPQNPFGGGFQVK
jgi:hypothetical protein